MTHSTILKRKQQLEEEQDKIKRELDRINEKLNDRKPPRTMEEVVEAVKPTWWIAAGKENKYFRPERSQTHSESAARQLQAFNDVQNICKALNDYYGGSGRFAVTRTGGYFPCKREHIFHAITPMRSIEACQEFMNNPEFMERLRTLYTPCE